MIKWLKSKEFAVNVDVYQRSVLSSLPFIILEALPRHLRIVLLSKLLYANYFILIAKSSENVKKFQRWQKDTESRGIRVNLSKTKVVISS